MHITRYLVGRQPDSMYHRYPPFQLIQNGFYMKTDKGHV